jgi:UDP-N-acetylglucosamine acyltransferase
VQGEADLAEDVRVGPGCVIDGTLGPVTVAPGTCLIGHVYLYGPVTIGENNTIYPFSCLGFTPQSINYDAARPGQGLVVGHHNTFREGTTLHRAMTDEGPTTIGDHNYFMSNTHAGHDVRVADHCILASGALLGGHVTVEERVTIGGNTSIHQHCRVGRGAMLSGSVAMTGDLAPFFMLTGINVVGSINVIGMRRMDLPPETVEDIRWVYKTLYRRGLPLSASLEALRERADRPMVSEYIAFIEASSRGLLTGRTATKRGQAH